MMEKTSKHVPVLLEEAMVNLQVEAGRTYLDCTFGGGGHSRALLSRSAPDGTVIAIDRDGSVAPRAVEVKQQYLDRFEFHHLSYDRLNELDRHYDGILFDLGISSDQLESPVGGLNRGFSFSRTEPLDMRFDNRAGQTAAQVLMQSSPDRLERIFRDYAEDRYAKSLARKILERRRRSPIRTTTDFVEIVGTKQPSVLAPLFQALRIEVNDELQTLSRGLALAAAALKSGGRLVVISFHSLEDRMVKEFMREHLTVVTKKPITSSTEEQRLNPRSRSAKLRSAEKP